jgi:predicted glycosyltransferase
MCENERENVETLGLIDSRAGGQFIDQNYAQRIKAPIQRLEHTRKALNMDGTKNKAGRITSYTTLKIKVDGREMDTNS